MTPPAPSRRSVAGRAYNDLRNLARRRNRDPAEYMVLYALEGFLSRLSMSDVAQDFVLKGGVLITEFTDRRPTQDIDFAGLGFANDVHEVESRVRRVLEITADDGLLFDLDSVRGEQIRDEEGYPGVRVKVIASLVSAKIPLHIDVNFGDPIWTASTAVNLPLLLGGELRLEGYPDHMVLAEKIVTAVQRGELNTRWRDFTDIAAIAKSRSIVGDDLQAAIKVVADYRRVRLESLSYSLSNTPGLAQRKWETWRRKHRLKGQTPERFEDLLIACTAFADRALANEVGGLRWFPDSQAWSIAERP